MALPNLVSKSLQTTRRFDALKLWMTIEAMGEETDGSMIDHGVTPTRAVADHIKTTEGLEAAGRRCSFVSSCSARRPEGYPAELLAVR